LWGIVAARIWAFGGDDEKSQYFISLRKAINPPPGCARAKTAGGTKWRFKPLDLGIIRLDNAALCRRIR
jgi:hypothetical protein